MIEDDFKQVLRESWGVPDNKYQDEEEQNDEENTSRRDMLAYVALNTLNCLMVDQDKVDAKGRWKRGVSLKSFLRRQWPGAGEDQYSEAVAEGQSCLIEIINKNITRDVILKFFDEFKHADGKTKRVTRSWKKANEGVTEPI